MLQWNDQLAVGVPTIDEQHKELVKQIGELQEAMRQRKGSDVIGKTLGFLGEYAVKHFATEEGLMRLHKYPKAEEHKRLHTEFKEDFGRLSGEVQEGTHSSLLSIEVQGRLSDWLVRHIKKVDKELGAFLASKDTR